MGGLGFRSFRIMNDSFMLKIAWEVSKNQQDLWARVLRAKYKIAENDIPWLRLNRVSIGQLVMAAPPASGPTRGFPKEAKCWIL